MGNKIQRVTSWIKSGFVVLLSGVFVTTMVLAVPFEARALAAWAHGQHLYTVWEGLSMPGGPEWEGFENPNCKGKPDAQERTALTMYRLRHDEWSYQRPGMSRCLDEYDLSIYARKSWDECRGWVRGAVQFYTQKIGPFVLLIVRVNRENLDRQVFYSEQEAKQAQPEIVREWQNAVCGWSYSSM